MKNWIAVLALALLTTGHAWQRVGWFSYWCAAALLVWVAMDPLRNERSR